MAKRKSNSDTRISRAVVGLQIPMMQIPALYKHLENLIAAGADDAELKERAALFIRNEQALDDFNYVGSRHHY
jgi:hypothetical protein